MSANTKIQWAHHTWNPWRGCAKVSPGCANCYAEEWGRRFGVEWGHGKPRKHGAKAYMRQPFQWDAKALAAAQRAERDSYEDPLTPTGYERPRVFPSLMDWLDPEVPIEWLVELLDTIRQTPNLDWLLLTKRPQLWKARIAAACDSIARLGPKADLKTWIWHWLGEPFLPRSIPPSNVWLGVSAEDQQRWDERVPVLLRSPALVRFVSVEPMLGPVEMSNALWEVGYEPHCGDRCSRDADSPFHPTRNLHWIILGGESGRKARPCNVDWIRSGVRQCWEAGVRVFVKQLGSDAIAGGDFRYHTKHSKGGDPEEWPEDLRVREFPAK